MSNHDESRLPRWAREELQTLRRNLEIAKEQLNQAMGATDEPSPIRIEDFGKPEVFMPERTVLVFGEDPMLRGRSGLLVRWVREMPERGPSQGRAYVEVMAGSSMISIRPQAANVIRVYEEPR